jgi:hypothetical protein
MLFSHRFDSAETLSRAKFWLNHHGFEVVKSDGPSHDPSRLVMSVAFSKAAAALALIGSIENSEPRGWPLLDAASEASTDDRPTLKNGTPIHWEGRNEAAFEHEDCRKISEYMFSRWE